jgi:hypothetical protein
MSKYDSGVLTNRAARVTSSDGPSGELFPDVDFEDRIPAGHPLRLIGRIDNQALASAP